MKVCNEVTLHTDNEYLDAV